MAASLANDACPAFLGRQCPFLQYKFKPGADDAPRINMSAAEHAIGHSLEAAVRSLNDRERWTLDSDKLVRTKKGMLVLPANLTCRILDAVIVQTVEHVRQLLQQADAREKSIRFVLLAGGFANAPYLQLQMTRAFDAGERRTVIVPRHPERVVTEGALRFGLSPKAFITTRCVARAAWRPAFENRGCLVLGFA